MTEDFEILDWDSEFFGFSVAKILPEKLTEIELAKLLKKLRASKVRLVYWTSASLQDAQIAAAAAQGGKLVDKRETFSRSFDFDPPAPSIEITEFSGSSPSPALISLSIQSGLYSRFRVDPEFSPGKFEELYSTWMQNSVEHTLADKVFVAMIGSETAGMITCSVKGDAGEIGLVAVDERFRGKKIGAALVDFAGGWFFSRGLKRAKVVTQGANLAARALYESRGYALAKTEPTLHFWIK